MAWAATSITSVYGSLLKIILCSSLVLLAAGNTQDEEKPELNILGLFSLTGTRTLAGNSAKLVAELAIEQINNRTDILPNHRLKLYSEDSQVSSCFRLHYVTVMCFLTWPFHTSTKEVI